MPELDLTTKLADWKVKPGEVYLFDASVRPPCDSEECGVGFSEPIETAEDCEVCQGRGWTASTDLATWEQAITRAGFWWSRWMASTAPEGFTTVWRGKGLPKTTTGCSLSDLLSCVEQVLKEDKYA